MGGSVDMLATQDPDREQDDTEETPMYEKYDHLLHGSSRSKKYVHKTCTSMNLFRQNCELQIY